MFAHTMSLKPCVPSIPLIISRPWYLMAICGDFPLRTRLGYWLGYWPKNWVETYVVVKTLPMKGGMYTALACYEGRAHVKYEYGGRGHHDVLRVRVTGLSLRVDGTNRVYVGAIAYTDNRTWMTIDLGAGHVGIYSSRPSMDPVLFKQICAREDGPIGTILYIQHDVSRLEQVKEGA